MTSDDTIRELTNCINYFWPIAARVAVLKDLRECIKADADQQAVIHKACEFYSLNHQSVLACEEMAELIKELSKAYRGFDNSDAIAEEIADVEIMMAQLKELYNCNTRVSTWKTIKLNRLTERMKHGCDTSSVPEL